MFHAYMFDLDGTLLDTVESLAWSGNRMLAHYGCPPLPTANYRYYAGDGASMLVRRCLRDAGDTKLSLYDEAEPYYRKIFAEDPFHELKHFPQMQEVIGELKKRGLALAVFSNKPHAQAIEVVERMFGAKCFDRIQGQMESIPRKPAPDGAKFLAEKLGVPAEEWVYVGDTGTDMQTGKNAGMYTVGVTWGFRPESELWEYGADAVIRTPEELLKFLQNQNTREERK